MRTIDISVEPRRIDSLKRPWLGASLGCALVGAVGSLALALTTEGGVDHLLETYLVSYSVLLGV